ncbi:hypothetical protein JOD67_002507 [Tenggerimyces flavus]|nr:hypothetical protein [Tenggerimyces flavus]
MKVPFIQQRSHLPIVAARLTQTDRAGAAWPSQ